MKKSIKNIIGIIICFLLAFSLFAACNGVEEDKKMHMVIFDVKTDDESVSNIPEPQNVREGSKAARPQTDPVRSGYTFKGWYADEDCTEKFDFNSPITKRTFVYAKWELQITYYNVAFNSNYEGGPEAVTVSVESGDTVDSLDSFSREGYRFIMWSTSASERYRYNFSTPVTNDLQLYAIWEKEWSITFNLKYSGSTPFTVTYLESEKTNEPDAPERTYYTFGGWFTDADCTTAYEFGDKLNGDLTLYAKWTRSIYLVTFEYNYPDSPQPITVEVNANSAVNAIEDPVRQGYAFDGWFAESSAVTEYNFGPVTDDITIYAGWTKTYIITFDSNYEGAPSPVSQEVRSGESADAVEATREGWLFGGWYNEPACQTEYDFGAVTSDITVYAKWIDPDTIIEYFTVTFDLNYEGSTPITQQVAKGAAAERPANPSREGYVFSNWVIAPDSQVTYKFGPVNEDITVYARWVQLHSVTFDLNYPSGGNPNVVFVSHGQRVNRPQAPVREQWAFLGWSIYQDGAETLFDFASNIMDDVYLYAQWLRVEFNITWDFNYDGAPSPVITHVNKGGIAREPERPDRPGYTISGWYLDRDFNNRFNFGTSIEEDLVLYAKWVAGYSFRIDLNYPNSPIAETVILNEGDHIPNRPNDPVREGYTFVGWTTTHNGNPETEGFDGFGQVVTQDITIYAQWRHTYVFEAEYTDLSDVEGAGWSGGTSGTGVIMKDTPNTKANASNGYFISYLYSYGVEIFFDITSDRETDATLILRLSAEQLNPLVLNHDEYLVKVNDQQILYGGFEIIGARPALELEKLPFDDVVSVQIHLLEGQNRISLITNNKRSMGGTMDSTAPMVDCIKIDTIAVLTWEPILSNIED